jgi:hypothetical protein
MCSLSQSTSFRAENVNSSDSASAICSAEARSSAIHDADPTCNRGFARIVAIFVNQNNARRAKVDHETSKKFSDLRS